MGFVCSFCTQRAAHLTTTAKTITARAFLSFAFALFCSENKLGKHKYIYLVVVAVAVV